MNINRRKAMGLVVGATAVPLVGTGAARAQTMIRLTMASSHPTVLAWVGPLETVCERANAALEERGSEYRIDWTQSYGGQLYGAGETLEAVTQLITDAGWIGALFEPSALPLQNIMYATPFSTSDLRVAVETMNAMNRELPAMQAEWDKHDVMFFGASCSDGYSLFTKEPLDDIMDLRGRRIVGAASTASYIEPLGAAAINSALPEFYSQLQTGVADGVIIVGTGAYPLKLHEVAPYATRSDTGPFTFGAFGMNKSVFDGLPEEVQEVLVEMGQVYSDENAKIIEARDAAVWEAFPEEGATVRVMPTEEKVRWAEALPPLGKIWVEANEGPDVPAREILVEFMQRLRDAGAEPLRDWAADL
ncbi:C4-dicarboxylate TRAP transporter substrate-binding protein [Histidinibacterium aquaticum]|uniref:C4-dicarboxylate ABC transporter substrate-binding protein n=1 Tax=Histidinibacterium aquaticum TaxID=2613962 RepID=A0A5J5GQG2_9RHOB|nr:C4-dicarboxylate TRAP transporter substrate-binding protein [Histidinibacterium aquaticum]KAA9009993.1 C4-dicarboxylate ABC transporter substrate-binding protein [Histidinibacterium aquaticum]